MVQKLHTTLSKLKMDNGQLKIIYNNFPFSIFHFPLRESRVQIFAPLLFIIIRAWYRTLEALLVFNKTNFKKSLQ